MVSRSPRMADHGKDFTMSIDYENMARVFNTNIEGAFREMGVLVTAEAERIREVVTMAYKKDLIELDAKARVLDDLLAIVQVTQSSPDVPDAEIWRKIRALLEGKGML